MIAFVASTSDALRRASCSKGRNEEGCVERGLPRGMGERWNWVGSPIRYLGVPAYGSRLHVVD
jgi:hypothetical protein